jgi:hypothetical protein
VKGRVGEEGKRGKCEEETGERGEGGIWEIN